MLLLQITGFNFIRLQHRLAVTSRRSVLRRHQKRLKNNWRRIEERESDGETAAVWKLKEEATFVGGR